MNYVEIINLIFAILGGLFGLYIFHFVFFAISGVVHRKRYPKVEEKCRYGVIVSAKDEENVIGRLIDSIRAANYPQDKLDIFVIAHNCTDRTGEVAKSMGAIVITDNNKEENTLGLAYRYAFQHIDNISSYDGFIFFNADNTVDKEYFNKINDAFVYYGKVEPVTTFRHSLNMNDGTLPALYSYYFATSCLLAFSGRNNFGVSGRVTGCGFLVPSCELVDGWKYLSITEDIEFSANEILKGKAIHFCYEATFYDEQPTKVKTMWFQRLRWAKGQLLISKQMFSKFFKALFSKDKKNKGSLYVSLTFHSFIVLTMFFMFATQIVLLLFSPLFGISFYDLFLYWNPGQPWYINLFASMDTGLLFTLGKGFIFYILNAWLTALAVLIAGREKYKGYKFGPLFRGFLLYPLFLALQLPLDLASLGMKEVKWKKIPHGEKPDEIISNN